MCHFEMCSPVICNNTVWVWFVLQGGYATLKKKKRRWLAQSCPALCDPAPLSMEFSRQDCWNGLPFPSLGDLPDLGIKFMSLVSPALAGRWISLSTHKREGSWVRSVAQTADENMTLVLRLPRTEDADVRVMPKNRGCRHMPSWRGALLKRSLEEQQVLTGAGVYWLLDIQRVCQEAQSHFYKVHRDTGRSFLKAWMDFYALKP